MHLKGNKILNNTIRYVNNTEVFPLLLNENLYTKSFFRNEIYSQNDLKQMSFNFIKIKRIIHTIRNQKYFQRKSLLNRKTDILLYKNKTDHLAFFMVEPLLVILSDILRECIKDNKNQSNHTNILTYNSIQLALINIEYKWTLYGNILQNNVYHILHPEIILRILRKKINDACFLHILRHILYHRTVKKSDTSYIANQVNDQKLIFYLFNICMLEFDDFFSRNCSSSIFDRKSLDILNKENLSFLHKIKHWNNHSHLSKIDQKNNRKQNLLFKYTITFYQYIRTKNIWFLNIKCKAKILEIFEQKYINFTQYRLGYIQKKMQTRSNLSQYDNIILGYYCQFNINRILIQAQGLQSTFHACLITKLLIISNPVLLIINILATYRFCTFIGFPVSKSGWAPLADTIIISRFKNIRDSLITYYKGANNQKDLSHINHILQYSCAKTLACKHKTNLRKIWKRYGENLSAYDAYIHKKISFQLFKKKYTILSKNRKRFWNLYIKEPDPIGVILQNMYN